MRLSEYVRMTEEKHNKQPDVYEREVATILLQIVKGILHIFKSGIFMTHLETENVFLLDDGQDAPVSSNLREVNRCPCVVIGLLPGIGNNFQKTEIAAETNICHQLAFILYELLHSPYHDELREATDMTLLLATLPDLTIRSVYSRFLQYVANLLLSPPTDGSKSLHDLKTILEVILFGPTDVCDVSETDSVTLIDKWHNRRCVDMVTHILKEVPLVMFVSNSNEDRKRLNLEISLECEFLSDTTAGDIYRVSKMLNR